MDDLIGQGVTNVITMMRNGNSLNYILFFISYLVILLSPIVVYSYMHFNEKKHSLFELVIYAFGVQCLIFLLFSLIISLIETSATQTYKPSYIFFDFFGDGSTTLYDHWNNLMQTFIQNNYNSNIQSDLSKLNNSDRINIFGTIYIFVLVLTYFEMITPYMIVFVFVLSYLHRERLYKDQLTGSMPVTEYINFIAAWVLLLFFLILHAAIASFYVTQFLDNNLVGNYSYNIIMDIQKHTADIWGI